MCFDDQDCIPRRAFLQVAVAAAAAVAAKSATGAQRLPKKSLDDPTIIHKSITFRNQTDVIEGYLARPKAQGSHRLVIVLHGNAAIPEDIRNTAAQLGQAGFVGLAVSSTSREPDPSKISREFVVSERYIKRYLQDAQAGIDYLMTQPFVSKDNIGLVGFCGGGYTAFRLALISAQVRAIVAFYAPPISYASYTSTTDQRPQLLSFIDQIKVPIQCHFGTNDEIIPMKDVEQFVEKLPKPRVKAEVFRYLGADHGFANYTNSTYRASAARLAERRMIRFLKFHLN